MKHAEARQEFCYSLSDEFLMNYGGTSIRRLYKLGGHPYFGVMPGHNDR